MNITELFGRVDKSPTNEADVDTMELAYELDISNPEWLHQEEIKSYWLGTWLCTDTYVGYRLYFFKDKPMAFSYQLGRKSSESFYWVSKAVAEEVKTFLNNLMQKNLSVALIEDLYDVGDSFTIDYHSEMIHKDKITLDGKPVKFKGVLPDSENGYQDMVSVEREDGTIMAVKMEQLAFGYRIV